MCGISGHISWAAPPEPGTIRQTTERLRHRGPDHHAIWQSPDERCVLGHARLSILDLTPAGNQPMVDPRTGTTIVFNGEIYNFQELRRACEREGEVFHSRSDTEVILALYRRHGVECLSRLRGMFAFAIWDGAQQRLFMARDRLGQRPLNYALENDGLVFASEIDALAGHPGVDRELDEEALGLYLQLQYIPAPWTIYRGIRKLPPGHFATFGRDGLVVRRYWTVDHHDKLSLSVEDATDALEEKLTEAVRLRMVADVPVGALLSGGVDSSLVVALMAGSSAEPVRTFSIGFAEEAYSELEYAGIVADRYGTRHHPEVVGGEVQSLLPGIVRSYGEPFADKSAVPSFLVSRVAREHVKVAMNGDGGDELLGGYPRYALSRTGVLLGRAVRRHHDPGPAWLARAGARLKGEKSLPGRVRRKLMLRALYPELQSLTMYRSYWYGDDLAALLGPSGGPAERVLDGWWAEGLARAREAAEDPVERMLWLDNQTYLSGALLVKMDIASMHCGLETRSPFLDHELVEFAARLPVDLKVRGGVGKYLLKRLAERYLPRDLIYRRKMGFGIPLAEWLRGPLRPLVDDVLGDPATVAPLQAAVVQRIRTEFLDQGAAHQNRVWALLMFGLWKRECLQSPGTPG